MNDTSKDPNRSSPAKRRRVRGNKFVTKSGNTVKIHRTLTEKSVARREAKLARKAERQRGLPKSRTRRLFWRLHPKRVIKYWFSRDGLILGLKLAGIAIVIGFFSIMAVFAYFRKDLPNLRDISGNNKGGSVRYVDRTGQTLLWEDYDAVKRIPVPDDQISQFMKDATVAIEDRGFFEHGGFDTKGIARAAYNNAFGGTTQGGSTITQQLVKLTNDGFETQRTVTRKVKELILSVETERSYSKKEILNAYLNVAPYGGIEYGVEVASQTYFHIPAKNLTLEQSAFLASIPKSPVYYAKYSKLFDKAKLKSRSDYVLDIMYDTGKITSAQRDAAKKVDVVATVQDRQGKYTGITAPYFVLAAKDQLETKFTENTYKRGGWKVTTTIDLPKQKIAEEEVAKELKIMLASPSFYGFDTAAFVAEDVTTGQVVALVGGGDFSDTSRAGQINFAQQPLPPGSSFKPYDYVSLIDNTTSFGAGSVLYDSQGKIDGYPCTNKNSPKSDKNANCLWDYDFRYPGPITLRYAIGGSRNVPAVKAMLIAGVDKTIEVANKLGLKNEGGTGGYRCYSDEKLTQESQCYASSAIGDGAFLHLDQHVHAYATISRNGNKIPQTYILKVEDSSSKKLYEWKPSAGEQVVRPEAAYIVADIMSDPNASYFPAGRKPHRYKNSMGTWNFAMKTGTTNDNKDGWMMGYSTQYAAGVWVGYHSRQIASRTTMENMTQPIWQGWMNRVHADIKPFDRVKPAGIQTLAAFVVRSHVGIGSVEPSTSTDLFPSWYQKPNNKAGGKQIFDKVSGKLATDCTPELAREEHTNSDASIFSGDTFVTGSAASGDGEKDDVHKCEDTKPNITFVISPTTTVGTYAIKGTVNQGSAPLSGDKFKGAVTFKIDGQVINGGSLSVDTPGDLPTITYIATSTGTKTITADIVDSVLYSGTFSIQDYSFISAAPGTGPADTGTQ